MAIQTRPGYLNPLTAIAELQTKQQALQNHMLLLKATGTDSGGATAETQKIIANELEQVTAELRSAEASGTQSITARPSRDRYEHQKADSASPGCYQVKKDAEQDYRLFFQPYAED